jgi:hypothetical protein
MRVERNGGTQVDGQPICSLEITVLFAGVDVATRRTWTDGPIRKVEVRQWY